MGDMDADSVLLFEVGTRQRRWVRVPLRRKPVPPAALEAARAAACNWATAGEAQQRCETAVRQLPAQREYPVFRDLAVDSLGYVWVASYPDHTRPDSSMWLVLDGVGREVGVATLPANLRLTQIGRTYVLGVARDSVGVERVQEFRLSRPH